MEATGFRDRANVHRTDVRKALSSLTGHYHLVLLDPPYKMEGLNEVLEAIAYRKGLIVEGAIVIAGHSKRIELRESYGNLRQTSHRRYGDNVVDFYSFQSVSHIE